MAESIRYFEGDEITCHANVALTGARFCAVVGEPVGTGVGEALGNPLVGLPTGSGATVLGVTATDAASGDEVGVWSAGGQCVWVEIGTGGIVAGTVVQTAANGTAITRTTGVPVGLVLVGGAAGAQGLIKLTNTLV
jgi:hypothetical protein